jgi:hypothetical protein
MQSDENDGNAQDQNLSHCVQLYRNPSGHFLAGVPANLQKGKAKLRITFNR